MKKMVFYVHHKGTVVNANKCPILKDILPEQETLKAHLRIESLKKVKAEKEHDLATTYSYSPLTIRVERELFVSMKKQLCKKFQIPWSFVENSKGVDDSVELSLGGIKGTVLVFALDKSE